MGLSDDALQIINRIDCLGKELREGIAEVHTRLDTHLADCRARHNGTNLQQMNGGIEELQRAVAVNSGVKKAAVRLFDVLVAIFMALVAAVSLYGMFR